MNLIGSTKPFDVSKCSTYRHPHALRRSHALVRHDRDRALSNWIAEPRVPCDNPIGSNGSAQAIIDAAYLAECFGLLQQKRLSSIENALLEYEADRLPKTTGIVLRNRLNRPEQAMQVAEGFVRSVEEVIPRAELEEIAARYKQQLEPRGTAPSLTALRAELLCSILSPVDVESVPTV